MYAEPKVLDPDRVRTVLSAAVDALGGSERPGQVEMADAVATAWTRAEHLLVQAGTGTGKSLTYPVPALLYRFRRTGFCRHRGNRRARRGAAARD